MKLTQLQKLYSFMLCGGTVDKVNAKELFDVTKLSARMNELRNIGVEYSVGSVQKKTINAIYYMSTRQAHNNIINFNIVDIHRKWK